MKPAAGVTVASPAMAPVAKPTLVGLPTLTRSISQPGQRGGAGGDMGVDDRGGRIVVGGQRRAAVEAEPADPQQRRAGHRQRRAVRQHQRLGKALRACRAAAPRPAPRRPRWCGRRCRRRNRACRAGSPASRRPRPSARPAHRRSGPTARRTPMTQPNRARSTQAPDHQRRGDRGEAQLEQREGAFGDGQSRRARCPGRSASSALPPPSQPLPTSPNASV